MSVNIVRILQDVQDDFEMCGLTDELYGDYAAHVAYNIFHKVVNQCVQEAAVTGKDEDVRKVTNRISDIFSEAWNDFVMQRNSYSEYKR